MKEPNHAEPGLRYLRLVDSLRTRILDGVYHPGERLPRQHDFARENNVSFTTLKRALDILEEEGYVLRKEGHGTYISIPDRRVPTALVIDDDEGIRGFFSVALAERGWDCVLAASGQEGLDRLGERRFDLCFWTW